MTIDRNLGHGICQSFLMGNFLDGGGLRSIALQHLGGSQAVAVDVAIESGRGRSPVERREVGL